MPRVFLSVEDRLDELEDRLAQDLALSKGTMTIEVIVESEAEAVAARNWVARRSCSDVIKIVVKPDVDAQRRQWLSEMKPKPRPPRVFL